MSQVFNLNSLEWSIVRPDVAEGVHGKTLLDGSVKIVLTRVAPGGAFLPHRDGYGHLFYFLSGTGVVGIGEQRYDVGERSVVTISAGAEHFYRNTGPGDLTLLSLNIPGLGDA
jgi:mannose-6-phosphate isomerase-like protein (cupin superfamily)